jgi:hypothetical protein
MTINDTNVDLTKLLKFAEEHPEKSLKEVLAAIYPDQEILVQPVDKDICIDECGHQEIG